MAGGSCPAPQLVCECEWSLLVQQERCFGRSRTEAAQVLAQPAASVNMFLQKKIKQTCILEIMCTGGHYVIVGKGVGAAKQGQA